MSRDDKKSIIRIPVASGTGRTLYVVLLNRLHSPIITCFTLNWIQLMGVYIMKHITANFQHFLIVTDWPFVHKSKVSSPFKRSLIFFKSRLNSTWRQWGGVQENVKIYSVWRWEKSETYFILDCGSCSYTASAALFVYIQGHVLNAQVNSLTQYYWQKPCRALTLCNLRPILLKPRVPGQQHFMSQNSP